jgi:hypothetical protein
MSRKSYLVWCVVIVGLGSYFSVTNLLTDGVSVWDFVPIAMAPMVVIALTVARKRDQ